jgi:hypothetical protein
MKFSAILFISILVLITFNSAKNKENPNVVQIDISKILNARSVSTYTNGKITTWTKGIDGNGIADGYLTMAAAIFVKNINPKALPDNPLFPASDKHPEILLHYSNSDSISNQTLAVSSTGSFEFDVPVDHYSKMFLALTSSEGESKIQVDLVYSDGIDSKYFVVPDYFKDIPETDSTFCYLAHDLAKWGKLNNMTEKDHHNIDLMNVHPNPKRKLTQVKVSKTEAGYLVFWAATGVVK